MTFPTDAEARGITDYVQAHSFDDAQCAECGTVRWEHPAHFLDFLAPLIRAREAVAWDEGYGEGVQRGIGLERTGHLVTRRHELGPIPTNPYARQEADDARD